MPPRITNILIALLLLVAPVRAVAETWSPSEFTPQIGQVISRDGGLTLSSNAQGQILVSVPAGDLALSSQQRVSLRFNGDPPPRIYVVWRQRGSDELFQHGFAPQGGAQAHTDMNGVRGWDGQLQSLELGFLVNPGGRVTLEEVRILTPGWKEAIGETWASWHFFRPWYPVDVNRYPGTRNSREGPYPAQFFALSALLLVLCYLLVRRTGARWSQMALIVFSLWLALDALWQWRLWQQLGVTRERYAGLDSSEKALASEDAAVAQLAAQARGLIDDPLARVFIASQVDSTGMRAAYYMSPLNTFWHRHGQELPARKYLQQGDYILIAGSSAILYNRNAGRIRTPDGDEVAVRELHATQAGLFLEVAE